MESTPPHNQTPAEARTQAPSAHAATVPTLPEQDRFYARVFAIAATAALGFLLFKIVAPFVGALIWALFVAFLLHPLHTRLTARWKGRATLSAGLLTAATFILVIGPLTGMSAAFVAQVRELVHWVQDTLAGQSLAHGNFVSNPPILGTALRWAGDALGIDPSQIQAWIVQSVQHLPQWLAGLGGQLFLGALNTVLAFAIMLVMLFFFIRDGAKFFSMLKDLVPMEPARREQLIEHVSAVTRAVVFGSGTTALIQGALVGGAFLVTGLSSPLVFGVLAALLALLPFGGTAWVWIPAVGVLIAHEHWGMAVLMLALGILSSTVDNIVRPLLISGRAEVGTLTIFIGVLGGTAAFGLIGLFIGPVVLALIIALVQFAHEQRPAA